MVLALAALLLVAPATANAADPDPGTSLLDGLTGGLGRVVDPVTEIAEPVTQLVEPVTEPIVEPIVRPLVEPVLEPVTEIVEPVVVPIVQPVAELVHPVTSVVGSVSAAVDPILEPVGGLVEPVIKPIVQPVVQPVEDISAGPPTDGDPPRVEPAIPDTRPDLIPDPPAIDPIVAENPSSSSPVFDGLVLAKTPSEVDPGPSASQSAGATLTSLRARLGPIGSFGTLGSGQSLSGVAFGVSVALGLLLLYLSPPPFRVSRLHLAAVFWRPQRFVGPLERPG